MGDHQNIVFVGRFDPRNGLDTMIDAFKLLHAERGSAVRLVVVGDGPLRRGTSTGWASCARAPTSPGG